MQSEALISYAEILDSLNEKWQPHAGQIPIGKALFYDGAKKLFACCGRNFGKTQLASYACWRWALENPGCSVYIFEPFNTQAREILWASNVIQTFGPVDAIDSVNNTEMRITFKNGSFIKVSGSDNFEAYRGIKPTGLCVFDEYKDLRTEFMTAFEPNLAAYNPPALYIGTPPEFDNHFTQRMDYAQKSPDWVYFHAPTSINPYISAQWLEEKKAELIAIGEEETWIREYEARFVKGGKKSIFPQFLKLSFKPLDLPKDLHKWTLFISLDPAASSTFGIIMCLFNQYTRQIIVFDELYIQDPVQMTSRHVFTQVSQKIKHLRGKVRDIRWVYDEAARYFQSEIYEIPKNHDGHINDWALEPSRKAAVGIDGYVTIVRGVLNKGLVTVSDNCTKFRWEMDNYIKDENGRIPKKDDHLINAFQYSLQAMGFGLEEIAEPKAADPFLVARALRIESDMPNDNLMDFDDDLLSNYSGIEGD